MSNDEGRWDTWQALYYIFAVIIILKRMCNSISKTHQVPINVILIPLGVSYISINFIVNHFLTNLSLCDFLYTTLNENYSIGSTLVKNRWEKFDAQFLSLGGMWMWILHSSKKEWRDNFLRTKNVHEVNLIFI